MSDMYPDCDIVGPDTMRLQWSEEDPVTVFWREDEECSHYQTRFLARHSLPARALVSYPGSGNTWTRYTCTRVQQLYTCTTGTYWRPPRGSSRGPSTMAREYTRRDTWERREITMTAPL